MKNSKKPGLTSTAEIQEGLAEIEETFQEWKKRDEEYLKDLLKSFDRYDRIFEDFEYLDPCDSVPYEPGLQTDYDYNGDYYEFDLD